MANCCSLPDNSVIQTDKKRGLCVSICVVTAAMKSRGERGGDKLMAADLIQGLFFSN